MALIATPGQDNVYILTRGVAQGRRATLVSAWGVSAGLLVHTILAAAGLSAILARSAVAFSVVKYVGAAYLVYLGLRMLLSREALALSGDRGPGGADMGKVFAQGVASNVLNPKVALFFLAFLPQFAGASGSGVRFLLLGLLFVALTLVATTVLALFCGAVGTGSKAGQASPGPHREGRRRRAPGPGGPPGAHGRQLGPRAESADGRARTSARSVP